MFTIRARYSWLVPRSCVHKCSLMSTEMRNHAGGGGWGGGCFHTHTQTIVRCALFLFYSLLRNMWTTCVLKSETHIIKEHYYTCFRSIFKQNFTYFPRHPSNVIQYFSVFLVMLSTIFTWNSFSHTRFISLVDPCLMQWINLHLRWLSLQHVN